MLALAVVAAPARGRFGSDVLVALNPANPGRRHRAPTQRPVGNSRSACADRPALARPVVDGYLFCPARVGMRLVGGVLVAVMPVVMGEGLKPLTIR